MSVTGERTIKIGVLAAAFVSLTGCTTTSGGDTAKANYDRIVAEISTIRPPALRDLPPSPSRTMFGPLHTDSAFVPYRCEYALNPDGTPCDLSASVIDLPSAEEDFLRKAAYTLNFARIRTIDPELTRLDLVKHFPYASGELGSSVRVFGASPNAINFLVNYPWGSMAEIRTAAADYCSRHSRDARFVGAAEACLPPRTNKVSIGAGGVTSKETRKSASEQGRGKDKQWETWLLVPFDCVDKAAAVN